MTSIWISYIVLLNPCSQSPINFIVNPLQPSPLIGWRSLACFTKPPSLKVTRLNLILSRINYILLARTLPHVTLKLHHLGPNAHGIQDLSTLDYVVLTCLINIIELFILSTMIFLSTTKEIWIALHKTYSLVCNVVSIYTLYKELCDLK